MEVAEAKAAIKDAVGSYRNKFSPHSIKPYDYWGKVERIVDADTIDLTVSLGFDLSLSKRFRLIAVDAPETFSVRHDSDEYALGVAARKFVEEFIKVGDWVEVEVYCDLNEKYGRELCQLFINGISLNEQLLIHDHAKIYG
jgi:micrococcal nuclease